MWNRAWRSSSRSSSFCSESFALDRSRIGNLVCVGALGAMLLASTRGGITGYLLHMKLKRRGLLRRYRWHVPRESSEPNKALAISLHLPTGSGQGGALSWKKVDITAVLDAWRVVAKSRDSRAGIGDEK